MIASIAAHGSLKLGQGAPLTAKSVRAVAPVSPAPVSNDRPPEAPAWHSASTVALAPAAMSALIEAQERMGSSGTEFDRQKTAQKLDRLISRLDAGDPPPPPTTGAPFTLRRLQTARDLLV